MRWMMPDLRYTLRRLVRTPTYAAAAIVTFALALGANAAVFSLVRAILLEPVQVPEPDRLVRVYELTSTVGAVGAVPVSVREFGAFIYPRYVELTHAARSFTGLAASFTVPARVRVEAAVAQAAGSEADRGDADHGDADHGDADHGDADHGEALAVLVTPNFFDVTGVGVQRGRGLLPADEAGDGAPVAVVSDRAWRRWFDGDPAVLGRVVEVNGAPLTIVGVLARGFRGLRVGVETDLYVPGALVNRVSPQPGNYRHAGAVGGFSPSGVWEVIGRLRPGVTITAAEAEMTLALSAAAPRASTPRTTTPPLAAPHTAEPHTATSRTATPPSAASRAGTPRTAPPVATPHAPGPSTSAAAHGGATSSAAVPAPGASAAATPHAPAPSTSAAARGAATPATAVPAPRAAAAAPSNRALLRTVAEAALPPRARMPVVTFLALLAVVSLLVLAIGCLNLTALLLARGDERWRELGVRAALGAGRRRLASMAMTEVALLIGAGVLLAEIVRRLMLQTLSAFSLPGQIQVRALDLRGEGLLLVGIAALAVASIAIVGALPAWRASRVDVVSALKRQGFAVGGGSSRGQSLLLALQVTLSVMLMIGTGLFVRSIQEALRRDMGFDVERLLIAELGADPRQWDKAASARVAAALDTARERLLHLPGVRGVSYGDLPFSSTMDGPTVTVEGGRSIKHLGMIATSFVGPHYVETLGLRLLAGRSIDERDTTGPPIAVVSESFARGIWGEPRSAIGRRFHPDKPFERDVEIVGVVRDTSPLGLGASPQPAILLPRAQHQVLARTSARQIVLRVSGDAAETLAPLVAGIVREVSLAPPRRPITTARAMMAAQTTTQQLAASLLGWFSGLALLLTCGGVYALTAYAQARRTYEIGVRVALGATRRQIGALVAGTSAWPVIGGAAAGLAGAWLAGRSVRSLLFGVEPVDATTWAISVLVVIAGAALASAAPLRRAVRVQPALTLRAE